MGEAQSSTKVILTLNTFANLGSLSKLMASKKLPNGVGRLASGSIAPQPSREFVMVRYLPPRNGLQFKPGALG